MTVAAVVLDMPMDYWRTDELPTKWPSVAAKKNPQDGLYYVEAKLQGIMPGARVIIVTPDTEALDGFMEDNDYFGRDRDEITILSIPSCRLMEKHTGGYVDGCAQEGSLAAMAVLFDNNTACQYSVFDFEYVQISFMEDIGAILHPLYIGILDSTGKGLLVETTDWKHENGPLKMKLENSSVVLVEREHLGEDLYKEVLSKPHLVRGVGTNNYYLKPRSLLDAAGINHNQMTNGAWSGQIRIWLAQHAQTIYMTKRQQGRVVVYPDTRLSILTHILETQYFHLHRALYSLQKRELAP